MLDIETLILTDSEVITSGSRHAPVRRLALIGNALPRKCGLATFTSHVADALRQRYPGLILDHYAIDDGSGVTYPDDIETIRLNEGADYRDAAGRIEASGAGAIWLQHEFGIFGGDAGAHILELLNSTSLPVVATLHTVLENPSPSERAVFERLLARIDHLVVMASHGAEILQRVYGLAPNRFTIIPHGVPDRPLRDPETLKDRFGWKGQRVLMTFGLLAPDKGIQHMIEAMPAIVAAHPDILYAVVGATHPNLVRSEGERYREGLMARASELGVADHIRFTDAFVEQEELLDMLQASDIYVTPYLNMGQVTSGTLSYAVAVGKPVVSTPYMHARELLADDHGVIVEPANPAALAEAVAGLLNDDRQRAAVARRAYGRGRTMLWRRVVERALAPLAAGTRHIRHRGTRRTTMLPLTAVEQMSDGTGILQHAIHNIADRRHGYCIDDNARALILAVRRGRDEPQGRVADLASTYAAFLQHGWNEDQRRYRNFMSFERVWLEPVGSEDSNGRTMWALGITAAQSPWMGLREWAKSLFEHSGRAMGALDACRARTFAALGAHAMLERHPGHDLSLKMMRTAGDCLMAQYDRARREDWEWFEPDLAYDNARLCEGLLKAGQALGDANMIEVGLATLDWLVAVQTGPRGSFRPVGSNGFGRPYAMPLAYDQQPLEAAATIDAAATAFTITGDERWERVARDAFGWFFGDNDGGIPLADVATGGCFDGLMATGINRNQGAESILALQLSAATMADVFGSQRTGQEQDGPAQARVPIHSI
ncbi:MAG: glycosyltransferase family 4 protein [Pseudomonadota bacterium]|nr:glycosyltransferase family 4 protein [Pseudomonadota bacterium]